jgi:hopene-associated glycosyltransferase HpnB
VIVATAAAVLALLAWLYLLLFHHRFWLADQRLAPVAAPPAESVVAVVPARNEADVVGQAVVALLAQQARPPLRVVLVDDGSGDGTAAAARAAAAASGAAERLIVLSGAPRPPGWTGKLWAMQQGVERALRLAPSPRYLLLTDADIAHAPGTLAALLAKAAEGQVLVSLMVRLHCVGLAERLLVPAFVFFFQKLYPFRAVSDPGSRIAGAAGGCMLLEAAALARAGGIAAIRGALIDDCALGRLLKRQGPIWLGLTRDSASLRPYDGLVPIWRMVARTAYTQLRCSPALLAGAVLGMLLLYLAPPLALLLGLLAGDGALLRLGAAGWLAMALAYAPTLHLYRRWPLWGLALPAAALLYTAMTVDSARRHWQGRGGEWKGRIDGGRAGQPESPSLG